MRRRISPRIFLGLLACAACSTAAISDPLSYVNLFIGTVNGGHTFPGLLPFLHSLDLLSILSPGATVPHGMVKAGMDTDSPGNVRAFQLLLPYHLNHNL